MIKITSEQFEELKRLHSPEVFTEAQMNAWVEGLKDTLVKAEVDELDEQEKAVVDEFNHEFTSFVKVQVISTPSDSDLSKGLKYDNFFMREKQVEWTDDIQKSEDGEDKVMGRTGTYLDTKLNRDMNRVGLVFGGSIEKSENDELEKGGEGSKGGKIIGHTKSGKAIYDSANHPEHKEFTEEDHKDRLHEKHKWMKNSQLDAAIENHSKLSLGEKGKEDLAELKKERENRGYAYKGKK
jgi:hypothetical protein